ncbi:ThiF family adenylyltransferase [Chloroflexota bacterium]
MKDYSYADLIARNWGFLTSQDQEKIKEAKILLAGCGLGSNIATLAARTGFIRFILADGDNVEVNNLNRQAFRLEHVGKNKAEATAKLIEEINPEVEIEILPHFITEEETTKLVTKAELIVNMVDPGPVIFSLNHVACHQNKMVFFPLNIGFGGMALVFSPDSATLEDILEKEVPEEVIFHRLIEKLTPFLPQLNSYFKQFPEVVDDITRRVRPVPQLGIAASINASLIVTAMIRTVLGLPVKVAPYPLALDAWTYNQ